MVDLLQKDSSTSNTVQRKGAADASAVTQEEWEAKYATVTGLLPAYKSCKDEELAARAELETLQFTLATVSEQRKTVEDRIGVQERQVGAEGFAQASVLLDKVGSIGLLVVTESVGDVWPGGRLQDCKLRVLSDSETTGGRTQVSEQKGKADAEKGERMNAISEVVEQINSKIRSRKGVLAPKITDLRAARSKHAEVCAGFNCLVPS